MTEFRFRDYEFLWGQEEKETTENEMAGWITDLMDVSLSELQELVMDNSWGRKEWDMTE